MSARELDDTLAQDVREAFRTWVVERRVARDLARVDAGSGPRRQRALIGASVVFVVGLLVASLSTWASWSGNLAALWAPVLALLGGLVIGLGTIRRGHHPLVWLLGYLAVGAAIPVVGQAGRDALVWDDLWTPAVDAQLMALWFGAPVVLAAVWGGLVALDAAVVDAALSRWRTRRIAQLTAAHRAALGDSEVAVQRDPVELFDDLAAFMDARLSAVVAGYRGAIQAAEAETHAALADLDAKIGAAVALAVEPEVEAEALTRAAAPARERLEQRLDRADALLREAAGLEAALRERFRVLADLKGVHDREVAAAEASRRAREAIAASGAVAVALDDRLQRSSERLAVELGGLVGLLQAGQRALTAEREVARLSG